jgi:ubiquinone/menaquinone biosynthesis C-methylase UbiE
MSNSWTDFWSAPAKHSCLPGLPSAALLPLQRTWEAFAKDLPPKGTVLDLGSGDGAVLRILRKVRADLKMTGIDSAAINPNHGMPFRILGEVPMEKLPFTNRQFSAVVSQFGVEYSDVTRTAPEVSRVLEKEGQFLLLVHHSDSPIVRHNLARQAALSWAAVDSQYLEKAMKLVRARLSIRLATPPILTAAPEEARRRHPRQGVAWEFMTGVVQIMNSGRPAEEQSRLLLNLQNRALAELERISQLVKAAHGEAEIGRLVETLRIAGLSVAPPSALKEDGTPEPIAWEIRGCKMCNFS